MTNQAAQCSCGERTPHVTMRRVTADSVGVEVWHDGAITGRCGRALPGVPVARPRTAAALELARASAALVADLVELYEVSELPRLASCARRVAMASGTAGDVRAAFAVTNAPALRFSWTVYEADRDGTPTVRVARLDRIRWPGMVIWHERGKYELLVERNNPDTGARSRPALETTGFSFASQKELRAHLFDVQLPKPLPQHPRELTEPRGPARAIRTVVRYSKTHTGVDHEALDG